MRVSVVYKRSGLQDYEQLMLHLSRPARRFLQLFARYAKAETTRKMSSGDFKDLPFNNPPWSAAKDTNLLLYWTGWLANQVSFRTDIPARGEIIADVGLNWPNTRHPAGGNMTARNLVEQLVAGRDPWTPSPAQRHAFYRRVPSDFTWTEKQEQYSQPPRPFTDQITNDPNIYNKMHEAMDKALAVVLGDKTVKVRK